MAMLEVRDLEVYYGVIQALKGISFDVNQGEIVALIGANGAGKTTTLHTVTGLLSARSGHIIYEGTDITRVPGYKLVSMAVMDEHMECIQLIYPKEDAAIMRRLRE